MNARAVFLACVAMLAAVSAEAADYTFGPEWGPGISGKHVSVSGSGTVSYPGGVVRIAVSAWGIIRVHVEQTFVGGPLPGTSLQFRGTSISTYYGAESGSVAIVASPTKACSLLRH